MTADLAVVVCTNRRPPGLRRTLNAINLQSIRERLEIIVVDDGAPLSLEETCASFGAKLVKHETNIGLAAARNSGLVATMAPIVAFTDDDCIPDPDWAKQLLDAFDDERIGAAGGPVRPASTTTFIQGYYQANNPFAPLECELSKSPKIRHRLWIYVKNNVSPLERDGTRLVYTLAGANFCFRRGALEAVGGFDPGIVFGGEDEDMFWRLRTAFPELQVKFVPSAIVSHHFEESLVDPLRRAYSYGRGNARNCAKHAEWRPTIFPAPVGWIGLVTLLRRYPRWAAAALLLLPTLSAPRWLIASIRKRSTAQLGYAYIQFAQEMASNLGFLPAWWRFQRYFGINRELRAHGNRRAAAGLDTAGGYGR
jgi:GT2 family glycosyltransferase